MPVFHKAKRIRVVLGVVAAIGIASVIAYVRHRGSASERLPAPELMNTQSADQIDDEELSSGEQVSLGRLLGSNNQAIPPLTMPVPRPPSEDEGPDLSTPAGAVYSVLSLIDQAETDKLAGCFIEGTAATTAGNLYPSYLGHPVELVEVVEDGESTTVIWNATVHTEFSLNGTSRSPGETIKLTTRVVRAEDRWKLIALHDGVEDGPR